MVSLLLLATSNLLKRLNLVAPGFILGAFFFLSSAHADIKTWSAEPRWRNLGHWKSTLFSGLDGQPDGDKFYLSPEGKKDPAAELAATLKLFTANDLKTVCRYPARYLWLKEKVPALGMDPLKECPEFAEFFQKINAKSASLIFSSYFINSPASAFGHTFLRFNSSTHRNDDQDQAELLDYGINYAANMDTSNVLVYATKSMLGLFPGTFTAIPYYYKVREYNDFESRDLWEYKLRFTQEQIDLMVAHLWELKDTFFDYKFFTENCSYHILGLMDVGNPALGLADKMPSLYVVPIDTVRVVVAEKDLVMGVRYRPSVLSRLEKRTESFNQSEINVIREIVANPASGLAKINPQESVTYKAELLDAATDAFDFLHAEELVHEPKKMNALRHQILTERAITDHVSEPLQMTPPRDEYPENGHNTQRWSFMAGYQDGEGSFTSATMRWALHDLLDPLPGQPTFSEIHFASITGRLQQDDYGDGQKLLLENLDFFRVSSFQPVTSWQNSFSWTAKLGMRTVQDDACDQCLAGTLEAGGGASIGQLGTANFLALLTKVEADYSDDFPTRGRLALGPELWGRWVPNNRFSLLAIVGYKWSNYFEAPLWSDQIFTHSLELRYHANKYWSYALKGIGHEEEGRVIQAGFHRFF
jgi:hypothetical protein